MVARFISVKRLRSALPSCRNPWHLQATRWLCVISASLLSPCGASEATDSPAIFRNPLGGAAPIVMGDPFVLRQQGTYFLFGTTQTDRGFEFYVSSNLVQWRRGGWAWEKSNDSWATGLFWAPEVFQYRNRFYLIYSGQLRGAPRWQMRLALAVADQAQGPYRDLHAPWFDLGESTIDGHVFIDDDGKPYLYFSRNGAKDGYLYGILCGVALEPDLSRPVGTPIPLLEANQPWECVDRAKNRCNEAPSVHKRNGIYYMTYSANNTSTSAYGIGVATAQSPLGPWTKFPGNPIAQSDPNTGVSGPGHNSIIESPDGRELFAIYHAHADKEKPSGPRVICIDRLFFDPEGNLRMKGPTRSLQPYPSGATQDDRPQ